MCGICGAVSFEGRALDPAHVVRMRDAMRHRGPDDEGLWVSSPAPGAASVGLGHRRLAIIDLTEAGHQPMENEDGSVRVVFNGEIYNFQDLRPGLEERGHRFRSHSDTEVILHLYEEEGEEAIRRLDGMFALALWDARRGRLLLARDRMGKKPLHYATPPGWFLFASELKGLLAHPGVRATLDPEALLRYLTYEYVPAPRTIWREARKVLPGHLLVVERERIEERSYWKPRFLRPAEIPSPDEAARHLTGLLTKAVERRLVSDVPLGVFLSGGIDSSAVVALMTRLRPPASVKTFSIGFHEKSYDESPYARAVADAFGTDHQEEILGGGEMLEVLPEVMGWLDEPFADSSILPTYLLARFTRRRVTVALGGDGGDELFAGYPTFQAHRIAELYRRLPGPLRWAIEKGAGWIPPSPRYMSLEFRARQFLQGIALPAEERNQGWLGSFLPEEARGLLTGEAAGALGTDSPYADLREALRGFEGEELLDRIAYLYYRFYLQDDILVKVDRASMAVSLEARAPFLDTAVVEFASALPPSFKIRGLSTKWLLKKALGGIVPPQVLHRKKQGFGIPIAHWLNGDLRGAVDAALAPERLRRGGLLRPEPVARLLAEHRAGRRDHRKPLWTLFAFQRWADRHL